MIVRLIDWLNCSIFHQLMFSFFFIVWSVLFHHNVSSYGIYSVFARFRNKIKTAAELRAHGAPIVLYETESPMKSTDPVMNTTQVPPSVTKKVPVVTKISSFQTTPVQSAEESPSTAPVDVASRADVFRQTRPKIQHRDSWVAESSKRFDFSRSKSTGNSQMTLPPTQDDSRTNAEVEKVKAEINQPEIVTRPNSGAVKSAVSAPLHRTFSSPTRKVDSGPSQKSMVARYLPKGVFVDVPRKREDSTVTVALPTESGRGAPVLSVVSSTKSGSNSRLVIEYGPNLQGNQENGKLSNARGKIGGEVKTTDSFRDVVTRAHTGGKIRPVSQFIPSSAHGQTQKESGDFMESIVKSWKNGTPTPYHHVNVTTKAAIDPPAERRMVSVDVAESTPAPPPPPPPPPPMPSMNEKLRMGVEGSEGGGLKPVKMASSMKRDGKSSSMKEPPGGLVDQRAELFDAIKSFPMGSLRKVRVSFPKFSLAGKKKHEKDAECKNMC